MYDQTNGGFALGLGTVSECGGELKQCGTGERATQVAGVVDGAVRLHYLIDPSDVFSGSRLPISAQQLVESDSF